MFLPLAVPAGPGGGALPCALVEAAELRALHEGRGAGGLRVLADQLAWPLW